MFGNIELFRLSQAMATHASTRLGVIAQNVANADTPGYRGQDTVAFTPDWTAHKPRLSCVRHGTGIFLLFPAIRRF